jgi:PAS domain S-box-containing protein
LRDSENKLAAIIEFLPDATFVIDQDGKVVAWNKAMEEMTGVSKDDMIGQGDHAYTVPFYGERRKQLLDLLDMDDEEIASKYYYVKRKGDTLCAETFAPALHGDKGVYVWATAGPIFDVHGNRAGSIESIRDITERMQAEEELKKVQSSLRVAMDLVKLVQWEYDVETDMFSFDDQFYSLYGTTAEREGGLIMSSQEYARRFIPPEEASIVAEETSKALATTDPNFTSQVEHRIIRADGTEGVIAVRFGIIKDSKGRTIKTYGANQDITERKKVEEELRQNRDRLEERVRERTSEMERFIYTVSHDLRSPLVTVSGFLGQLKEDLEEGDSQRAVTDLITISEAITKMDCLLLDTLELSRIGRVANPPEEASFGQIVQEALRQTEERIKSLDVAIYVAGDMPKVRVDVPRIEEVLVNLLENSVKYMGDQASPEIDIGSRKDGGETVFFVKDNGIGIDPGEHEKVFGLFYKVNKKSEGTGVGLAIVKRIIEVLGGRIWIESELEKGCTVCFTLPLANV